VDVQTRVKGAHEYGALALAIGKQTKEKIPLIRGIKGASLEELKSFSASFPTYSGPRCATSRASLRASLLSQKTR